MYECYKHGNIYLVFIRYLWKYMLNVTLLTIETKVKINNKNHIFINERQKKTLLLKVNIFASP